MQINNNNKLGKWLALPTILLSSALCTEAMARKSKTEHTPQTTDRIIVKYKAQNDFAQISSADALQSVKNRAFNHLGLEIRKLRKMSSGAEVLSLGKFKSKQELDQIVATLRADANVEYVEPDLLMQPLYTPNDSRYNEQWHYFGNNKAGIKAPGAWDYTKGAGAVVAVLDTGYRPHTDLNANIIGGYDMISDKDIAQDGNGRDSNARDPGDWAPAGACYNGSPASNSSWHGTHVAGTIAAVSNNNKGVAGVAFKAKVVPVRVLGRCGGYTSDIADGIIWAAGGNVSGVPSNPNPADVINMSLGGGGNCGSTTQNAINTARSLGATVVVAAGNENQNASNSNPANCNGVITVASLDKGGNRAYYSNYGNVVDIAAPGGETNSKNSNGVLSTSNSGKKGPGSDNYMFYQGTSMAAPHVAGVAALMYSLDPGIKPNEVESIIKSTARNFTGSCSGCGAGMINAKAAVKAVDGGSGGGVTPGGWVESNLSASSGTWKDFTVSVPSGATKLDVIMSGGSGDGDLYVKFGGYPDTNDYDCRPYKSGNNESCSFSNPQAGTWYISIYRYNSYSGVRLEAAYE